MRPEHYLTIGSVAAEVGVPRWRLAYLIERGTVPGPSLQVPGRRLFSSDDVECIRRALIEGHRPSTGKGTRASGA
jgi:DNA-binding transcriptional MerR regulator